MISFWLLQYKLSRRYYLDSLRKIFKDFFKTPTLPICILVNCWRDVEAGSSFLCQKRCISFQLQLFPEQTLQETYELPLKNCCLRSI